MVEHPWVRSREQLTRGERAADLVVGAMGSWPFILAQLGFMAAWAALNVIGPHRWDPYPFILLNLALSCEAAFAASLILIAAKRSDQRSREVDEHDFLADRQSRALLDLLVDHFELTPRSITEVTDQADDEYDPTSPF